MNSYFTPTIPTDRKKFLPYLLPPLVFLLLGPAIGFAVMFAEMLAVFPAPMEQLDGALELLKIIALSYIFGGLPALVTGVIYVPLWAVAAGLPIQNERATGCVTGVVSVVPVVSFLALYVHGLTLSAIINCFIAAAVCGSLACKVRATGGRGRRVKADVSGSVKAT
jgi:hypothetical protein